MVSDVTNDPFDRLPTLRTGRSKDFQRYERAVRKVSPIAMQRGPSLRNPPSVSIQRGSSLGSVRKVSVRGGLEGGWVGWSGRELGLDLDLAFDLDLDVNLALDLSLDLNLALDLALDIDQT